MVGDVVEQEDVIVFAQPVVIAAHDRRGDPFEPSTDDLLRLSFELGVRNPARRQLHQGIPVSLKAQLKQHADYAVVVILDLRAQRFPAAQHYRIEPLYYRRLFEADILGRSMFEATLNPLRAQDLAQLVQPDFFTDVVENDAQDGTLHSYSRGAGRHVSACSLRSSTIVWDAAIAT